MRSVRTCDDMVDPRRIAPGCPVLEVVVVSSQVEINMLRLHDRQDLLLDLFRTPIVASRVAWIVAKNDLPRFGPSPG